MNVENDRSPSPQNTRAFACLPLSHHASRIPHPFAFFAFTALTRS